MSRDETMSKMDLFLELAQPDENGESRWVYASEFTGKYAPLVMGNGGDWCRGSSNLAKKYKIEKKRDQSPGNSIDAIRLVGFNDQKTFNQAIRKDISATNMHRRITGSSTTPIRRQSSPRLQRSTDRMPVS